MNPASGLGIADAVADEALPLGERVVLRSDRLMRERRNSGERIIVVRARRPREGRPVVELAGEQQPGALVVRNVALELFVDVIVK